MEIELNVHRDLAGLYILPKGLSREEVLMEGPFEPNTGHLWLMFCCVHLKGLMQGFLHFL
jgi:hypothetical protein